MTVFLQSFGYKYGRPEAHAVFDVRCMENPYWQPRLRPLSGRDRAVRDFIFENPENRAAARSLVRLLRLQARLAHSRGRKTLRVAVGCTGGRHRSVAVTEFLARELRRRGLRVRLTHRDVLREGARAPE